MATIDFEIRVAGEVAPEVLADLDNARVVRSGVETILRGPVPDQSALIGVINWLQLLGVEVTEVRQIGDPNGSDETDPTTERR